MKTLLILIFCLSFLEINSRTPIPTIELPEIEIIIERPKDHYFVYDNGIRKGLLKIIEVDEQKVIRKYYPAIQILIDSAKRDGINLKLNSGFRTFEDQIRVRKKYIKDKTKKNDRDYLINAPSDDFNPETGKPGHSRHQNGTAYDFSIKDKNVFKWLKGNAIKYGFVRTLGNEKWHWEYIPEITDKYHYVKENHWSWKSK